MPSHRLIIISSVKRTSESCFLCDCEYCEYVPVNIGLQCGKNMDWFAYPLHPDAIPAEDITSHHFPFFFLLWLHVKIQFNYDDPLRTSDKPEGPSVAPFQRPTPNVNNAQYHQFPDMRPPGSSPSSGLNMVPNVFRRRPHQCPTRPLISAPSMEARLLPFFCFGPVRLFLF
jgi:hypothetical protein